MKRAKETIDEKILLPKMDARVVAKQIGNFIIENVVKMNSTGGVIGLSGGVDSTITAALTKKAFDKYARLKKKSKSLELVGYILPSATNNPKDAQDGINVAKKLNIRYEVIEIESVLNAYKKTNPEAFEKKFDKGNLSSRVRAIILNTKAATERKIVIGTGNKDEDFGIGYYTLFGDGAVHISPIGNLSKRLVKEMAIYLGFEDSAKRIPTAGLEEGQTDFGDLGYEYEAVEIVTEAIEQGFARNRIGKKKQAIELIEPMLAKSKFNSVEDVVKDILYRHYNVALPKAKLLHPSAAKITLNYE